MAPSEEGPPEQYESRHVHDVYDQIAPHFSSTRYKTWPIVDRFLKDLPRGAVGIDVGCGNGKYLNVNSNVHIVASDRSLNLVKIASKHATHGAVVADSLSLPHRPSTFDFAISIAVVHHLSTRQRRVEAIEEVLNTLLPNGKLLIFVWALEQKSSRRGWGEGDEQDVMVPWIMRGQGKDDNRLSKTFHRYYHLYRKHELEEDIKAAGGVPLDAGYERDNWWAVCSMASKWMTAAAPSRPRA